MIMLKGSCMKNPEILDMERTLSRPIGLDLSVNDLRIIVGCFNALAYWARRDDEPYLDPDGWKLKDRLDGLYRDELNGSSVPGAMPGLCVGY
jgi:hypothetical protein